MLETMRKKAKRQGWLRWIRSEADERAMATGCRFDKAAGERVCTFFETFLNHTMGEWAGKPFTLLDWQRNEVLMPLFGWMREDGTRRYRKGDIFVAKKNGKTTLVAGLALFFLLADGEPRSEVYGASYTRQNAGIMYQEAAAMARSANFAVPTLFDCRDSHKRIMCPSTGSFYQTLAGEAGSVEGVNAHAVLFDEIHVQKTDVLWKALTYAKSARRQPMTLSISTVGTADRSKIWWSRYEYAKGIIAGTITDHSAFGYVAQADEACASNMDLAGDERQWRKANPSLGETVKIDQFREDYIEARNSPVMFNAFLRYRLNVPTAQEARLLNMDDWDSCRGEVPDLSGRRCYGGLDLADTDDIAALVLCFPASDTEPTYMLPVFWCPEYRIQERIDLGHGFYDEWRRAGLLRLVDGRTIRQERICADIRELAERYEIAEIGYDGWNAGDVADTLTMDGVPMVKVPQTVCGLSLGTKRLMDWLRDGAIRHDGNAVLRWMAGNAAGITDTNENVRPAKNKSAEKIDGIVAAVMAVGRAAVAPLDSGSSYQQHGMMCAGDV